MIADTHIDTHKFSELQSQCNSIYQTKNPLPHSENSGFLNDSGR